MYKHVLCVYPYRQDTKDAGFLPPLGLELIAAVLEPSCRAIDLVDLRKLSGRTADFQRPDTDLVCFSVNWNRDLDFIREEIRSVRPGAFVLLGGRHATEDPESWLASCPNVSAVVRGDGEETVDEIAKGVPLENISGLSFRRCGEIVHNPTRVQGEMRNDLVPARHLRRDSYQLGFRGIDTGLEIDMVSASRGCPFNCSFCSFSRNPWGNKRTWTARSAESVVDELAGIRARIVGFTDDLFTHDLDRVERICDLLVERGIRKKYVINARLEIAKRPALLRKMERAGFLMLMLGVESTQDRTLRSMRKGFDTKKIRECFDVLRQSRMILHGYFILGNIGETAEEMEQTLPFARELGLDSIAISMLRTSPFSGLEELVAANPGYHIAPSGKIYSDHCSIDDLRRMRREIYRGFFTTRHLLRLGWKGARNGVLAFVPGILPRLPRLAWALALTRRDRHKKKRRLGAPESARAGASAHAG